MQTAGLAQEKGLIDTGRGGAGHGHSAEPGNLPVPGLPVCSEVSPPSSRVSQLGGGLGQPAPFSLLPEGRAWSEIEEVGEREQAEGRCTPLKFTHNGKSPSWLCLFGEKCKTAVPFLLFL